MKTGNWIIMLVCAGTLALAGCGKQKAPPPIQQGGVTIDVAKLRASFATSSPDIQASASEVAMGVRYADYPRAFAGLSKLESAPGLTDAQKKIVGEVAEQIKQASSKDSSAPSR